MADGPVRYHHPSAGFSVERPASWMQVDGLLRNGAAFVEPPSDDPDRFRANLNVLITETNAETDVQTLLAGQLNALTASLTDLQILDIEETELAGHPCRRVLGTYRQGIHGLTIEQWSAVIGDRAVIVTATCATPDFDSFVDTFARMAASVQVDGA